VRVIAGRLGDVEGPVRAVATEPTYLDISLPPQTSLRVPLPLGHAAFAYVFDGNVNVGPGGAARPLNRGTLAVLGEGNVVELTTGAEAGRLILVAGRPLREPVVKYGPFVMNTPQQIHQAIDDFNAGRF